MTLIQKINPINKEEEKQKFFFDIHYNPQFVYGEKITQAERDHFGVISNHLLPQAEKICQSVMKKWGSESAYLAEAEGAPLSQEQVSKEATEYLKVNGIEKKVQVKFLQGAVSPASMTGNTLTFRLPIAQRSLRLQGTLNHEVGTHFFRRLNDDKQPWSSKRTMFGFQPYLTTEEGLATLHSHLSLEHKQMWFAALYYIAVYQSSLLSFSDLFAYLKQYIDDRDRRWNITLRAKRGMTDTSIPGAIAKDQVYLSGVHKMLEWLEKHDYDPTTLYVGKIAVEDIDHAKKISPQYTPLLPEFLKPENHEVYIAAIKDIKKQNML